MWLLVFTGSLFLLIKLPGFVCDWLNGVDHMVSYHQSKLCFVIYGCAFILDF